MTVETRVLTVVCVHGRAVPYGAVPVDKNEKKTKEKSLTVSRDASSAVSKSSDGTQAVDFKHKSLTIRSYSTNNGTNVYGGGTAAKAVAAAMRRAAERSVASRAKCVRASRATRP